MHHLFEVSGVDRSLVGPLRFGVSEIVECGFKLDLRRSCTQGAMRYGECLWSRVEFRFQTMDQWIPIAKTDPAILIAKATRVFLRRWVEARLKQDVAQRSLERDLAVVIVELAVTEEYMPDAEIENT